MVLLLYLRRDGGGGWLSTSRLSIVRWMSCLAFLNPFFLLYDWSLDGYPSRSCKCSYRLCAPDPNRRCCCSGCCCNERVQQRLALWHYFCVFDMTGRGDYLPRGWASFVQFITWLSLTRSCRRMNGASTISGPDLVKFHIDCFTQNLSVTPFLYVSHYTLSTYLHT